MRLVIAAPSANHGVGAITDVCVSTAIRCRELRALVDGTTHPEVVALHHQPDLAHTQ